MGATEPPEILGLLSDPLRWQLVIELGRSDRRVGELVQLVGKPQNLVSYHLAELRNAGIVTARRSSADGRDVYYRADLFRCWDLLGEPGPPTPPPPARATRRCTPPSNTWPTRSTAASICCLPTSRPDHRKGHSVPDAHIVNVRYLVDDVAACVDFYTRHFGFTVGISSPAF